LRPLFGTIWILIIILGVSGVTLGVQLFRTSLSQISQELEEAARISGQNRLQTIRTILVPLLMPTIVVVGLLNFSSASGAVSIVALVASGDSKPLALLQLEYASRGYFEPAAVLSIFILSLSFVMALLGRWYASRVGLARAVR
jgi:iron(III) transport system permease protein